MADGVVVRTNIRDFTKDLEEIGADARKVIRSGVAAGVTIFKKQIQQNAPVYQGRRRRGREPGTLKKNVIIKRLRMPPGTEHYYAGVRGGTQGGGFRLRRRKGAPPPKGGAFYWWMVEAGHRIVPRGRKMSIGGRRLRAVKRERFDRSGGVRTHPVEYIARAYREKRNEALQAFLSRIEQRIVKWNAKRTITR